jgi:hypothetical protein
MRTVGEYKVVTTNEQAIAEGYPNLASYQMAVRKEIALADEKARAAFEGACAGLSRRLPQEKACPGGPGVRGTHFRPATLTAIAPLRVDKARPAMADFTNSALP